MKPVTRLDHPALYSIAASRQIEQALREHHASQGEHHLMAQAGWAVARLALAIAPHARSIWIACGPGNNGGDGLVAAVHLARAGRTVHLTHPGYEASGQVLPVDAQWALKQAELECHAQASTLTIQAYDPDQIPPDCDLVIDALLGIGANRALTDTLLTQVLHINRLSQCSAPPVLAVDVPSGLAADTGATGGQAAVQASHTLSLVCLRPGLFTGMGRQLCGQVWLDDLGAGDLRDKKESSLTWPVPLATWGHATNPFAAFGRTQRSHASHKGSFGDVAVVGGAPGMQGAAVLAASAAQYMGAGRVFLSLLSSPPIAHPVAADIMLRPWQQLSLTHCTVVVGCGAGEMAKEVLPVLLQNCRRLVLDADALNVLASNPALGKLVRARHQAGWETVMSPHPKEAARLLDVSTDQVQADRLDAARQLAHTFQCAVALKGSGTVVMMPGELPSINSTGNGKLAVAGTGDVLAGMLGSLLAHGHGSFVAAQMACYWHGQVANEWPAWSNLTASELVHHLPLA
jgi:hydroxyethylthiazole kinase-like uncharacterized protein yjeF